MTALARMRGTIPGAYAAMKLKEYEDDEYDWDDLVEDLKTKFGLIGGEDEAQYKIESLVQGRTHIADFLVMFDSLKTRAGIDDKHAIFLLKKNVRREIVRTIMGYPPSMIPSDYDAWKEAILSVGKGYDAPEMNRDRRTASGIVYGGKGQPMDIGRSKPAFDKEGKPKCFNCNLYGHMAKDCRKPKKKPTCYNCDKEGHIAKDCRAPKMKNREMKEEGDKMEVDEEPKGFQEGSE
jgi:hypothetical protein